MPKGLQGFQKGHQTFISKERYKEIAKKRLGQKNALGKHWKLSEETKKRQSLASKGKKKNYPVWNKGKKGLIVGWNKGLKGMQKWHNISGLKKKGDIPWNKGIPMSEKTKEKIREGVIANPNKIFKDTTIERKIEEELRKNDIGYKKQVSLCKVAKVDFLLSGLVLYYRLLLTLNLCYGFFESLPVLVSLEPNLYALGYHPFNYD